MVDMEKRVFARFTKLNNVVGRVDYISNPKRQENLLGFYQTPEDPTMFWQALADESQQLAGYNKVQMKEHNRIEHEKYKAGEIKKKDLWSTVEARENMICLPNDLYGRVNEQKLAMFIANDIRRRFGIECAVGVHMNKEKTNFHAHIIMAERFMLEQSKESVATRNTYFDQEGKRSTKQKCVDENGVLKFGCRLVRKGEVLSRRRFSEKVPTFANKGFAYGEKLHFAEYFNKWSRDHWVVYNHYQNPHVRLYSLRRGEPEGLKNWKEQENEKIRQYNAAIDRLMEAGELTKEQALQAKEQFYAERAERREQRIADREKWIHWYAGAADRRVSYREKERQEWTQIRYANSGRERSTFELLVILGLTIAGVNVFKDGEADLDENLIVQPSARQVRAKFDSHLQSMVDRIALAAGRRAPSEVLAERRAQNLAGTANRKLSLEEQMADAVGKRSERPISGGKGRDRPEWPGDR